MKNNKKRREEMEIERDHYYWQLKFEITKHTRWELRIEVTEPPSYFAYLTVKPTYAPVWNPFECKPDRRNGYFVLQYRRNRETTTEDVSEDWNRDGSEDLQEVTFLKFEMISDHENHTVPFGVPLFTSAIPKVYVYRSMK